MPDDYMLKLCNERHKVIDRDRAQDRAWTQSLEDKIDGMSKAIYGVLGGVIVNLLAIVIIYVLLKNSIGG